MSVDNAGNTVVVQMTMASIDAFHTKDTLVFSFVGQHGSVDYVADGVNAEELKSMNKFKKK